MVSTHKTLTHDTVIEEVPLIGQAYAKRLKKLGIVTIFDLLHHLPSRYEDFSLIASISSLQPGETVTIQGTLESISNEYTRRGKVLQKAKVSDQTGSIDVVWFNQPFLTRVLASGSEVSLAGKVDWYGHTLVLNSPEYEILTNSGFRTLHTGRLVPIYPETYGLSSKWLRSRMASLLELSSSILTDDLPDGVVTKYHLISYREALISIHFPESWEKLTEARRRLGFEELFMIQLASARHRLSWQKEIVGHRMKIVNFKNEIETFWRVLPFQLTAAQRRAVSEIFHDLAAQNPMNRLLEGDVGSGKTVVAAMAMYISHLNGFQSALMAPTEILAEQHYRTISQLLAPLGVKIDLHTGSTSRLKKEKAKKEPDILIGTHALLQKNLVFQNLALVVIDEQQRFGVAQRTLLRQKGVHPHLLTLTATPIPRTVALTIYGELDLSYLDEMPTGRLRVKTWVVPESKREAAYRWIRNQTTQVFIICPFIDASESLTSVKAAKEEYARLTSTVFPDLRLALLHGKLPTKEKNRILAEFSQGKVDILVATPVVEVGIDIPHASIMVIEAADRFGLSQLHQLRGRVGRGQKQSYCLLFTSAAEVKTLTRLKTLERVYVGSELAEADLSLRGPGEIFGVRQHGLANLRVADITDRTLVMQTKKAVSELLTEDPKLDHYPNLHDRLERSKIKEIASD